MTGAMKQLSFVIVLAASSVLFVGCDLRPASVPDDAVYTSHRPTDGYWVRCDDTKVAECAIYSERGKLIEEGSYLKLGWAELRSSSFSSVQSKRIGGGDQRLIPFRLMRDHGNWWTVRAMLSDCELALTGENSTSMDEPALRAWAIEQIAVASEKDLDAVQALFNRGDPHTSVTVYDNCVMAYELRNF